MVYIVVYRHPLAPSKRGGIPNDRIDFNLNIYTTCMPPFANFTTKAKEVIKRAHELALERGVTNVDSYHLLTALDP